MPSGQGGARKKAPEERHSRQSRQVRDVLVYISLHLPTSPYVSLHLPTSPYISLHLGQRAEERVALAKCQDLLYRKSHDFLAKDPPAARTPAQPPSAALVDGYG